MIRLKIATSRCNGYALVYPMNIRGGLSEVVKHQKYVNGCTIERELKSENLFELLDAKASITVFSPTGIFHVIILLVTGFRLFNSIFPKFYFDHNPFGFQGGNVAKLLKLIIYNICALFLIVIGQRSKMLVPPGPMNSIFPFSLGAVTNLSCLDCDKFSLLPAGKSEKLSYFYVGTFSREKLAHRLPDNFVKKQINLLGYLHGFPHLNITEKPYSNNVVIPSNSILVWTSEFESYALVPREWAFKGLPVVFVCKPLLGLSLGRSCYLVDDTYSEKKDTIIRTILDKDLFFEPCGRSNTIASFFGKQTVYHYSLFLRNFSGKIRCFL